MNRSREDKNGPEIPVVNGESEPSTSGLTKVSIHTQILEIIIRGYCSVLELVSSCLSGLYQKMFLIYEKKGAVTVSIYLLGSF